MLYLIIKAVHIIFMVSYFAGLFYLVRLFVYYKDTDTLPQEHQAILRTQYVVMATKLWNIIIVPAGIIMLAAGLGLLLLNGTLLHQRWFYVKLAFLAGLAVYHWWVRQKLINIKKLANESLTTSSISLRQANEVATFILFGVVFTVILKENLIDYWWQLVVGFAVLVVGIMAIVKAVNSARRTK